MDVSRDCLRVRMVESAGKLTGITLPRKLTCTAICGSISESRCSDIGACVS
jgi:hypothetical protein